jgi:hypothetical protein
MCPLVNDATGNNLTYQIIGAAMTVHNQVGPGFKEEVYEKALEVELSRLGIEVQRQVPVPVDYQGLSRNCRGRGLNVVFCAGVRPHKTPHLALRHSNSQ